MRKKKNTQKNSITKEEKIRYPTRAWKFDFFSGYNVKFGMFVILFFYKSCVINTPFWHRPLIIFDKKNDLPGIQICVLTIEVIVRNYL